MYAPSGLLRLLDFSSLPASPGWMVWQDVRTKNPNYFLRGSGFDKASAALRHMALPGRALSNKKSSHKHSGFVSSAFQFRVRTLLRPSQFGGQACPEPLVDSRPCFPTKLCNIVEVDCKNKFQCESGNDSLHCVTAALLVKRLDTETKTVQMIQILYVPCTNSREKEQKEKST